MSQDINIKDKYNLELISGVYFNTDLVNNINNMVEHMISAKVLPKICLADACENKAYCPIYNNDEEIEKVKGKYCPIEAILIMKIRESLLSDIDIQPQTKAEEMLINDLVEIQLLDIWRTVGPSLEENLIKRIPKTVNPVTKSVEYDEVINPVIDLKLRLQDRKIKILNEFIATRRAKVVEKMKDVKDPLSALAEIVSKSKDLISVEYNDEETMLTYSKEAQDERKQLLEKLNKTEAKSILQDDSNVVMNVVKNNKNNKEAESINMFKSFLSSTFFEYQNGIIDTVVELCSDENIQNIIRNFVIFINNNSLNGRIAGKSTSKFLELLDDKRFYLDIVNDIVEVGFFYDEHKITDDKLRLKIDEFISTVDKKYLELLNFSYRPYSSNIDN